MNIKYPKGETVWVSYYNSEHKLLFIMTSKPTRDYYYLYELKEEDFKKLGRAQNPVELEEKFKVNKKMSVQSV
mgnify:CR=1 FL=1